ncbi:hypothetical protein M011DRAFT_411941 [Sporormia fimetaria CBS 119925]|uniref:Nicotinamide N-methyltransferase n=1 Tax=Sporormia fimetaria CBS 119925 TaxID=1340428 RepID=A0A6A6UWV2_9PLEO|nr:hypothetical protein M011DRAFT_411941 [Sporormia fimetaria CBS 119925]
MPLHLPSTITLRRPSSSILSPEDIFSSSLGGIFTDDLQNQHGDGDEDSIIVYKNRRHGALEFCTADVNGEEQRRKFAHYLWNAGVLMGECVAGWAEAGLWRVEGETVLELGAGVGLAGIVACLSGADSVTISDYPAPSILKAIKANVAKNIPDDLGPRITVQGHQWGELSTPFAESHAHSFTRILAADCFWMPGEHENLAHSMLHFLSFSPHARVLCIAGFHTGRAKLVPFFEEVAPSVGLEVEDILEMDAEGRRRAWKTERDGGREDIGERKKWLVLARLRRAASGEGVGEV